MRHDRLTVSTNVLLQPDRGLLDGLCPPDAENTDRLIRSILRIDDAFGDPIAMRPSTSSMQMLAFQWVRRFRFARHLPADLDRAQQLDSATSWAVDSQLGTHQRVTHDPAFLRRIRVGRRPEAIAEENAGSCPLGYREMIRPYLKPPKPPFATYCI
eukprot:2963540-Prymnesium_polylepis.2